MVMTTTAAEFLLEAKELINKRKTYFTQRKDYNYIQALFELDLENKEDAWREVLKLKAKDQYKPPELDNSMGTNELVFFFRKEINGKMAYIKLTNNAGLCMCISFHPEGYKPI